MSNNLLVVTHGTLSKALKETAQMIFGDPGCIDTLSLCQDMGIDDLREKVNAYFEERADENVLVLVDIISGSPFNSIIPYLKKDNVFVTTGVNLPMILELTLKKDSTEFNEWCAMAKEIGVQGIVTKNDIFKKMED